MPQHMQAGVGEAVGGIKHRDAILRDATLPKLLDARSIEVLSRRIPESIVEINACGDFGVEEIAAKFPAGFADQGRVVIGEGVFGALERHIVHSAKGFMGALQRAWWREQIHVVADPEIGIRRVIVLVRETFQEEVLDTTFFKCGVDLNEGGANPADAFGVVRDIAVNPLSKPGRQIVAVERTEKKRQAGTITER